MSDRNCSNEKCPQDNPQHDLCFPEKGGECRVCVENAKTRKPPRFEVKRIAKIAAPADHSGDYPQDAPKEIARIEIEGEDYGATLEFRRDKLGRIVVGICTYDYECDEKWAIHAPKDVRAFGKALQEVEG